MNITEIKKPALTTTRAALTELGVDLGWGQNLLSIPESFWDNLPTQVSDRATCETDPLLQQLLPYIVLVDSDTKNIFAYRRGSKGAESRLIGKRSIGLGGHVDTYCPHGVSLEDHLRAEAYRELEEEAGIKPKTIKFLNLISDQFPDGNDVPVGSVHLGIFALAYIDPVDMGRLEEGTINEGHWYSINDLFSARLEFENWSQIIIDNLTGDMATSISNTNAEAMATSISNTNAEAMAVTISIVTVTSQTSGVNLG